MREIDTEKILRKRQRGNLHCKRCQSAYCSMFSLGRRDMSILGCARGIVRERKRKKHIEITYIVEAARERTVQMSPMRETRRFWAGPEGWKERERGRERES